jgi:hypothetical protein
LETQFQPTFTKQDLANLPVGNAYVKLLVRGQPTPPFSMWVDKSDLDSVKKDPEVAKQIREFSRNTYGTPVAEVEAAINKRLALDEPKEEPMKNPLDKFPF